MFLIMSCLLLAVLSFVFVLEKKKVKALEVCESLVGILLGVTNEKL